MRETTSQASTAGAYGRDRRHDRGRPLRRARRRHRHRAARRGRPPRRRREPLGHARPRRAPRRGARRAPPLRADRLRRHLHQHLGAAERAARGRAAPVGEHAAGPLDGRRPPRPAPGARGDRRRGARRRVRRGLQPQRRDRQPRGPGDDPPARPPARGGAARPDPGGDAVARRPLDLRDRRDAARDRRCRSGSASGAAATASAASTASTGAGPRATCSAARRAASRRWAWARCWSTASRPTTWPG